MADVLQILEEIQVILLNIKNDADFRKEVKETVGVFTGFRDKCTGTSNPDIPADCLQDSAHGDGRDPDSRQEGCERS